MLSFCHHNTVEIPRETTHTFFFLKGYNFQPGTRTVIVSDFPLPTPVITSLPQSVGTEFS